MSSPDPYQPPGVDLASQSEPRAHQVRIFSLKGRIGRIRMIAYPMGVGLVGVAVLMPVWMVAGRSPESVVVIGGVYLLGLALLALTGIWTIRRVQDFNGPWWVCVLFLVTMVLVPVVNFLLWIIPGSKENNRYGPPPPPNGIGVWVLASIFPAVLILGILAAIAIPAYQDYTIRARIQEGTMQAHSARTALDIACGENALVVGADNTSLGLAAPTSYGEGSAIVRRIDASVTGPTTAQVAIMFLAIGSTVPDGAQLYYIGECGPGGMTWTVVGSEDFPEKYLPKI